ncbi:signal recognition particle receptor subunit alpha-like isoform X2 [Portunus trituberculatus]|uniref:signal recognition particle receptor subunit alpha-like isoform X2 n=1 Tax=Portunus trituberculatus TaxID=210409 RepID=UPI001E1D03AC|nr:signal recognition particle receptor subunit alpha-like isoform X2 [Portunus trituberculatus]
MLDFFAVITKGGLVLWYFQDVAQQLKTSIDAINALIRNVVLQERGGMDIYTHGNLALKQQLDNEFDLLFVAVYQNILQLSYVDKFLSDVQREFRERYRDDLKEGLYYKIIASGDFQEHYKRILHIAEAQTQLVKAEVKKPRSFHESAKSTKTVSSMIVRGGDREQQRQQQAAAKKAAKKEGKETRVEELEPEEEEEEEEEVAETNVLVNGSEVEPSSAIEAEKKAEDELDEETMRRNREKLFNKRAGPKTPKVDKAKSPKAKGKKGKEATVWDLCGQDSKSLDYSSKSGSGNATQSSVRPDFLPHQTQIGTLSGNLRDMDIPNEEAQKKSSQGGVFSMFRGLVGGKTLTDADLDPVLEKLKDHLIGKNVAAEIAGKLCQSVGKKLEGKVLGTFEGITTTVRNTLTESLVQLLTPKRRLDILRDVVEAKKTDRPYTMAFCGVNGVGKSTNLAKITFWLVENDFRVLIAACDTFRAGAVEQLRTHMHHLNALHPPEKHNGQVMVQLFEQGYGKDAAEIARHAIDFSRKNSFDVVLIDTAGRMQDNEPLMRALAKLILVNEPDLTLFVGEALVGNEAVDQLVKFNRALANHSTSNNPQIIDGILLTKFDTIDDKVGAAISMTYITGQPIVFVGTGQTYTDLRKLDAKAVVHALMK